MRHAEDSHVLVDGKGTATLSGTEQEATDMAFGLAREGETDWEIRRINRDERCREDDVGWQWERLDWGD